MHRKHRSLASLLGIGLALTLGGCATNDAGDGGIIVSPSSTPGAATTGTPGPADSRTDTDADAAQCLQGTWVADNAYFLASVQEFGDAIDTVTGRVTLTFSSDNTIATKYADWLLSGTMEGTTVTISRIGVDTGVYSISDGALTINESSVGSTLTVTAEGVAMPVAPVPADYTNAAFTCTDASASITTADGTIQLTRD